MDISINNLLRETVKYCLILVVIILSSLLITKTSTDILIIFLVGWFTALLNFFLLAYFISKLNSKKNLWIALMVLPLRYMIFGISMYYCIDHHMSGLFWAIGFLTVIAGIIIAALRTIEGKEDNL